MEVWQLSIIIFLIIMFIVSLFLIGFSVRVISATDNAIKINNNVMAIYTDKLYTGGRYFAGLGYDYLRYTVMEQVIIFSNVNVNATQNFTEDATYLGSISARTSEGLIVTVDAGVYFKIGTTNVSTQKAAQLFDIWAKFGDNYQFPIIALTQGLIQDVASRYEAYQFYTDRQEVQNAMETELRANLNDLGFGLSALDILNLEFDPTFQAAVEESQVVVENTLTEQAYYDTLTVSADTNVSVASIDADIVILNANTNSNITFLQKQATANATTLTASIKISALNALYSNLGFNETQILDFLWIYYQVYASSTSSSTTSSAKINMGIIKPSDFVDIS